CARRGKHVRRVAAGRSAQRARERSSDWRLGVAGSSENGGAARRRDSFFILGNGSSEPEQLPRPRTTQRTRTTHSLRSGPPTRVRGSTQKLLKLSGYPNK